MPTLPKVHGSENTFFILDQTQLTHPLPISELSQLMVAFKNANDKTLNDIDGLLVVDNSSHPDALGKMTVINADGSIASMCGNGLRTVARYLSEKNNNKNNFKIETQDADLTVSKQPDLAKNVKAFGVEISPVRFRKEAFPFQNLDKDEILNTNIPQFSKQMKFTAIAVPNPHLISFVDDETLNSQIEEKLGKYLNDANPYFPKGVNLSFVKELSPNQLFVKTYERGVGFTDACGTGMTASSLAYLLNQKAGDFKNEEITVFNPGGKVKVKATKEANNYHLELIGNATQIGNLKITEDNLLNHKFSTGNYHSTDEEQWYQKSIKEMDD